MEENTRPGEEIDSLNLMDWITVVNSYLLPAFLFLQFVVLLTLLKRSYFTSPEKDKSQTEIESKLWRKIANRLVEIDKAREQQFQDLESDFLARVLRNMREMVSYLHRIDQEQEKTTQALTELTQGLAQLIRTVSVTRGVNHSQE